MQRETTRSIQHGDLLLRNETDANRYCAICQIIAAAISLAMWLLNVFGFFIVDDLLMNVAMPVSIFLFLLPAFLVFILKLKGAWLKYAIMLAFLLGVGVMSSALAIQLVLAWACPLLLSCHYYSPKFTVLTLAGTLVIMLGSFYSGIYIGVWDSNIMRSSAELVGISKRIAFIAEAMENGDNILLRAFNFYYLPRAVILIVIFFIGNMLGRRTHRLLVLEDEATQRNERISAELNVAAHIQSSMLPDSSAFPEREEFAVFAGMTAAKEVGGDFYDFFMVDETHLAIVIADVSGKGVPAALFMVIGKTLINDHTTSGCDLGEVFTEVNRILSESNSEGMFITAFEGVLDLETGEFCFVNAGHEWPYLCRAGEGFEVQKVRPGFVLAGMSTTKYVSGSLTLHAGDRLFLYTDGVTEAMNGRLEQYGAVRLRTALNRNKEKSIQEILPAVKEDIDGFVGAAPQFDDITMLLIEYRGEKN